VIKLAKIFRADDRKKQQSLEFKKTLEIVGYAVWRDYYDSGRETRSYIEWRAAIEQKFENTDLEDFI
jgi:hypothetical protein